MCQKDWKNCYAKKWSGLLVPQSALHPAKFARSLIFRIYRFLSEHGLLKRGDTVFDPFAGVACGALPAAQQGVNWVGIELEPALWHLGQQNIEKWKREILRYLRDPGQIDLINGDSTRAIEILNEHFGAVVSSPPYERGCQAQGGTGSEIDREKKLHMVGRAADKQVRPYSIISSPPFGAAQRGGGIAARPQEHGVGINAGYKDVNAIISSSPFEDTLGSDNPEKRGGLFRDPKRASDKSLSATYVGGVVSSAPFESCLPSTDAAFNAKARPGCTRQVAEYGDGDTKNQLGAVSKDDFWRLAEDVVLQCHSLLRSGAAAAWVCKDFVRNKQIVPFCDNWRELCERCGFETTHKIRAWQVDRTAQADMFSEKPVRVGKMHKGFFRQLQEQKGSPVIDYEVVWIMRKM